MSKLFYRYLITKKLGSLRPEVRIDFHRAVYRVYCNLLLNSNSTHPLQITIAYNRALYLPNGIDTWQLLYSRAVTCRRLLFHYKKSMFLSANKLSRGCTIFLFSGPAPMHLATMVTIQRNSLYKPT